MNEKLQTVVDRIRGLRKLTAEQGLITKRSQNTMLAELTDIELSIVAAELAKSN